MNPLMHGYSDPMFQEEFDAALREAISAADAATAPPVVYEPTVRIEGEGGVHIGLGTRIDSFCKLEGGVGGLWIGKYVHVSSFCHLGTGGGTTHIEDYVGISSGCRIVSGTQRLERISPSVAAPKGIMGTRRLCTIMRRFSFLGAGVTVLPGVIIGEGAVVGGGSVVTKNVPAWEIWAGNPLKMIGPRIIRKEDR